MLAFRARAHGLTGDRGAERVLDLGVQDTGPSGARWSLALRGADPGPDLDPAALALVWAARGAPLVVRRADLAGVAAAMAPYSEADAAKRVFDAARPLRAAGVPVIEALAVLAGHVRDIVTGPTTKGELSTELTRRLPAPYLRECRPCAAVHVFEQPFRLAALPAGLEIEPGTSPPVLRPVPRWSGPSTVVPPRLDALGAQLAVNGPLSVAQLAGHLDAAQADVRRRVAELVAGGDAVEVVVDGDPGRGPRYLLAADVAAAQVAPAPRGLHLLDPFDPLLQTRDRELVVPDEAQRKDLWRTLGRPGAVWRDGEVVGTWRPRSSGRRLRLVLQSWRGADLTTDPAVRAGAERLAGARGQELAELLPA